MENPLLKVIRQVKEEMDCGRVLPPKLSKVVAVASKTEFNKELTQSYELFVIHLIRNTVTELEKRKSLGKAETDEDADFISATGPAIRKILLKFENTCSTSNWLNHLVIVAANYFSVYWLKVSVELAEENNRQMLQSLSEFRAAGKPLDLQSPAYVYTSSLYVKHLHAKQEYKECKSFFNERFSTSDIWSQSDFSLKTEISNLIKTYNDLSDKEISNRCYATGMAKLMAGNAEEIFRSLLIYIDFTDEPIPSTVWSQLRGAFMELNDDMNRVEDSNPKNCKVIDTFVDTMTELMNVLSRKDSLLMKMNMDGVGSYTTEQVYGHILHSDVYSLGHQIYGQSLKDAVGEVVNAVNTAEDCSNFFKTDKIAFADLMRTVDINFYGFNHADERELMIYTALVDLTNFWSRVQNEEPFQTVLETIQELLEVQYPSDMPSYFSSEGPSSNFESAPAYSTQYANDNFETVNKSETVDPCWTETENNAASTSSISQNEYSTFNRNENRSSALNNENNSAIPRAPSPEIIILSDIDK